MFRRSLLVGVLSLSACDSFPLTTDVRVQTLDSVAAAADRDPDADVLEFTAIPRPDLAGYKTWTVSGNRNAPSTTRTAAMIPLVDERWTKEQPIAVWVRIDARADDASGPALQAKVAALVAAAKAGPIRVNTTQEMPVQVDMDGTNAFTIGAKRAMAEHGLVSPVGAVLATWPAKTRGGLRVAD